MPTGLMPRHPGRWRGSGRARWLPRSPVVLCVAAWGLCACGGAQHSEIDTRIDVRDPGLGAELHSGFAFAPLLVAGTRRDAAAVGAELTGPLEDQVATDLFLSVGRVPLMLAAAVRAALPPGPRGQALAALQRRRAAGEPLDPAGSVLVADAIAQRLLLVTWLNERDERGSQILATDLQAVPWPPDGGTIPYTRVHGELWGELVDLRAPAVVWRGSATYLTQRGTPAQVRAALPDFRLKAIAALARTLAAQ